MPLCKRFYDLQNLYLSNHLLYFPKYLNLISTINLNLYNLYLSGEFGICLYESLKKYKGSNDLFYENLIFLTLVDVKKAKENQTLSRCVPQLDYVYNSESLNRFITLMNNLKLL